MAQAVLCDAQRVQRARSNRVSRLVSIGACSCLALSIGAGCGLDTRPIHKITDAVRIFAAPASPVDAPTIQNPTVVDASANGADLDAGAMNVTKLTDDAGDDDCLDEASRCRKRCKMADDCPAADSACHVALCDRGACSLSALSIGTPCGDGGVCDGAGACTQCAAGAIDCSAAQRRVCGRDGRWGAPVSCPFGCTGQTCNDCVPTRTQCSPDGTAAISCNADGRLDVPIACDDGCSNGACNRCSAGATRCANNMQRVCGEAGTWGAAQDCGALGCGSDRCASCAKGASECQDAGRHVCGDDGQWGPTSACPNGCSAGSCDECTPQARRCTTDGAQTCGVDRRWGALTSCPAGCSGDQCARCAEGAVECPTATTLRTCTSSTWSDADSCRANAHCNAMPHNGNSCPCDPGFSDPSPSPGLCSADPKR
ncbi:MAG TPA: hypothetical protein VGI70_11410 [Polyangiales bacterium]